MATYDPYTKVLLHLNDSTFKDECGNTVTTVGSTTFSPSIKKFGDGSAYFLNSVLDINYKISDYKTVDFWFNYTKLSGSQWSFLFSLNNSVFGTYITQGNKIAVWYSSYGAIGTTTLTTNTWYHCAVTIDGSTIKLYLNGKLEISTTLDMPYKTGDIIKLMAWVENSFRTNGYIDEFRVSNIIRYTEDFTPPTSQYSGSRYLLKSANRYYSINSEYYDIFAKAYTPLSLSGGTNPNTQDIETYGFDIDELVKSNTINGETFKPIDKIYNEFEIKEYKGK